MYRAPTEGTVNFRGIRAARARLPAEGGFDRDNFGEFLVEEIDQVGVKKGAGALGDHLARLFVGDHVFV